MWRRYCSAICERPCSSLKPAFIGLLSANEVVSIHSCACSSTVRSSVCPVGWLVSVSHISISSPGREVIIRFRYHASVKWMFEGVHSIKCMLRMSWFYPNGSTLARNHVALYVSVAGLVGRSAHLWHRRKTQEFCCIMYSNNGYPNQTMWVGTNKYPRLNPLDISFLQCIHS